MNNLDMYDRLVFMAKISYRDLINSYKNKEWNAVIRRAQESVELYLKAILKLMYVEYPKSHDIGTIFADVCIKNGIDIDNIDLFKIKSLSKNLAEKRGAAFYMEKDYNEIDAEQAKSDAEFVMNFVESLSKKLIKA